MWSVVHWHFDIDTSRKRTCTSRQLRRICYDSSYRATPLIPPFSYGLVPHQRQVMVPNPTRVFPFVCRLRSSTTLDSPGNLSTPERPSLLMMLISHWRLKLRDWNRIPNTGINSPTALIQKPLVPSELPGLSRVPIVCPIWIELYHADFVQAPANRVNGGRPLSLAVFSCSRFQDGMNIETSWIG